MKTCGDDRGERSVCANMGRLRYCTFFAAIWLLHVGNLPQAQAQEPAPCESLKPLTIGYQFDIPVAIEDEPTALFSIISEAAAGTPCVRVQKQKFDRSAIANAVAEGRIDLGVIALPPASHRDEGEAPILASKDFAHVDLLIVPPTSHSIVAVARSTTSSSLVGSGASRYAILQGGLLGLVLLVLAMALLRLCRRTLGRNAGLPGLVGTFQWLASTTSGRLMGVVWIGLGITHAIIQQMGSATLHAKEMSDDDFRTGAEKAAYPGLHLFELRDGRWRRCDEPHECARQFSSGRSRALAGQRLVLCHYLGSAMGDRRITFRHDLAIPISQAFLLPAQQPDTRLDSFRRNFRHQLLTATKTQELSSSPWDQCQPLHRGTSHDGL